MTVASADELAVPEAAVAVAVAFDVLGCCAPQGWSERQAPEHVLFDPHAATHWLPYSTQTKYGSVREYSETFGWVPSAQRQP